MQYLLMLYSEEGGWARLSKKEQEDGVAAFTAYTEALRKADVYVGSNRLAPTSTSTRVKMVNGKSQVLDGPYAESKEQLAGYYLIDVADLDAALGWAARCPGATYGTVEVRPIFGQS